MIAHLPSDPAGPRRATAGFALLETLMAAGFLVFALVSFSSAVSSVFTTNAHNRETALASEMARQLLEQIDEAEFDEAFARFNANPADDPGGAGTAPGAGFDVPGLPARAGDADGLPGAILFPTGGPTGLQLREDVANAALGMPRDLDGDGVIDADDHKSDYLVLPVRVRVEWAGRSGPQQFELTTVLVDR